MLRPVWLFVIGVPVSVLWAGCMAPGMMTGTISIPRTIAGGETVDLPVANGGVVKASNDDVQIIFAALVPTAGKSLLHYQFTFSEKHPFPMSRVTVEDVSDDSPVVMVDDRSPKLDSLHVWQAATAPMEATPDSVPWLMQLEYSVRIYRFTIYKPDGTNETLIDGQDYLPGFKHYARVRLKLEKP